VNTLAAVLGLLACAVLTAPPPAIAGARLDLLLTTEAGTTRESWLSRWSRRCLRWRDSSSRSGAEPLRLAAAWDLLAACLRAGLPIPVAISAVADDLPRAAATALRATADLLSLGAEAVEAWAPAVRCPHTAELARAACRTARSGTGLAETATALAVRIRDGSGDRAEARSQRTAVLVTGPLGLCFLPAFLCLGVIPVVAGLAGQLAVLP
jgi:Flp pilus assembly protein TadB